MANKRSDSPRDDGTEARGTRSIREVNRSLVLSNLRRAGQISRSDLARFTSLTKPTISAIVSELIDAGVLREVGLASGSGAGRPARLLELNSDSAAYGGVHFGEDETRVCLANAHGEVVARSSSPALKGDPARSSRVASDMLSSLLRAQRAPRTRLRAVGVSVPGLIDRATGTCVIAPNLGWRNEPIGAPIESRLRVPVVVVNTTQAAALAEGRLGAARGVGSYLWLYVGDGVGAGIVVEGRVQYGSRGYSGEIGHCTISDSGPLCGCGRRGCLETLGSNIAIVRGAEEVLERGACAALSTHQRPLQARDVSAGAAAGDAKCQRILRKAGEYLGLGVSFLVNILNPEMVVVGGDVAGEDPFVLESLTMSANRHAVHPHMLKIVPSSLGADAYLRGALFLAQDRGTAAYRIVESPENPWVDAEIPAR